MLAICQIIAFYILYNVLFNKKWKEVRKRRVPYRDVPLDLKIVYFMVIFLILFFIFKEQGQLFKTTLMTLY